MEVGKERERGGVREGGEKERGMGEGGVGEREREGWGEGGRGREGWGEGGGEGVTAVERGRKSES